MGAGGVRGEGTINNEGERRGEEQVKGRVRDEDSKRRGEWRERGREGGGRCGERKGEGGMRRW